MTYDSARYCADYIGKALTGLRAAEYGERQPPFAVMSQGIGRQYCRDHADSVWLQGGVTVRGVPVGMPRYYARLLGYKQVFGVDETPDVVLSRLRHQWVGKMRPGLVALGAPRVARDLEIEARLRRGEKKKL